MSHKYHKKIIVPRTVSVHNVNDSHSRDVVLIEITENYGPLMLVQRLTRNLGQLNQSYGREEGVY